MNFENIQAKESDTIWTYLRWNSYLSSKYKLFYVATPKVACTSLKWWFAALEGYTQVLRASTDSLESDPDLIIHDTFHKVAPAVTGLEPEALKEALYSKDFFRFAVVRNPYARIFSAWQSKLLLREPLQAQAYLGRDFIHRPINNAKDIANAFEDFLEHLAEEESPTFWDAHWAPQAELLRADVIKYTTVSKIEEPDSLRDALALQVGPGVPDPFAARNRSNESLIPFRPEFISSRSEELIRTLYLRDFDEFGYNKTLPAARGQFSDSQLKLAIRAVAMVRGRHKRIQEIRSSYVTRVAGLEHAAHEQDAQISALNEALVAHGAQLEACNQDVAARDERLAELGQVEVERSARVVQLESALHERATVLDRLVEAAADRDARLAGMHESLAEMQALVNRAEAVSDARVGELNTALVERQAAVEQLKEVVIGRDRQLADLNHALAEAKSEIDRVNVALTQRTARLQRAIVERDACVRKVGEKLRSSTGEVRRLKSALVEKQSEVVALDAKHNTEVAALNSTIAAHATDYAALKSVTDELALMNTQMRATMVWRLARIVNGVRRRIVGDRRSTASDKGQVRLNPTWYLEQYPDVKASGMDPLDHFRMAGRDEGRLPAPPRSSRSFLKKLQSVHVALPTAVRRVGGVRQAVKKVVEVAKRDDWFASDFDEQFYLETYPDVREAGCDPYDHFIQFGRNEGRIGKKTKLQVIEGSVELDPMKKTVLVVSHEASRTGAPVLALNIAKELQKRFNVIALVLGPGPLLETFAETVPLTISGIAVNTSQSAIRHVLEQLTELHQLEFALVNSIESRVVLQVLASLSVPTVSLIHEFAAYTRPKHAFLEAIYWSTETVFSARITHDNARFENPELGNKLFPILPQGRCLTLRSLADPGDQAAERSRVLRALRPQGLPESTVVVIGVGFVQIRKGVDLFLDCAARVIKSDEGRNCRFVWIGKGYDPEHDLGYSVYLAEQIRRSGLEDNVVFMDETSCIEQAYEAADMLLLSSRLDPLPNVAIDAMAHGLPVICFDQTTGIVDALVASGLSDDCVAPYQDTAAMATLVLKLANSRPRREQIGDILQQVVREKFDMSSYVGTLEEIARNAKHHLASENESSSEILASGMFRPDFFRQPGSADRPLSELIRFGYVRSWATGIGRRKPFPGFHPGIYQDHNHSGERDDEDPLARYLRAGQPAGPWKLDVISSEETAMPVQANLRVALHLHVYYPDLLAEIISRVDRNKAKPDLFISVPNEDVARDVRRVLKQHSRSIAGVQIVPNVGRDIGPLITAFGKIFADSYDIVGHIHTKKTADLNDESVGQNWYTFLLENLLGGKSSMMDIILGRMAADSTIGLVFPDDPNAVGWSLNKPYAVELAARLGLSGSLPDSFMFPVGTMFWARSNALRPLFDLGLDWPDYPSEPLPYDGSALHAIERMLPFIAAAQGTRSVVTNVVGVTR